VATVVAATLLGYFTVRKALLLMMEACLCDGYCSPISAPSGLVEKLRNLRGFAAAGLAYYNGHLVLFYHVE
jgi:hypothetical protein